MTLPNEVFIGELWHWEKKFRLLKCMLESRSIFLLDHLIQEYVFIQKFHVHKSPPTLKSRWYMNGVGQKKYKILPRVSPPAWMRNIITIRVLPSWSKNRRKCVLKDMEQNAHLLTHIWSNLSKYQLDNFKMKNNLLSQA